MEQTQLTADSGIFNKGETRSMEFTGAHFVGDIRGSADFLGPGAIEVNRYQAEIFDLVRRRHVLGQRINQVQATGHPSRYFEQIAIPSAQFVDPRQIGVSNPSSQPQRVERPLMLKAVSAGINYSLFDIEVNAQQGQFPYLEAKDLTDTVDAVLKLHDQKLWDGNDTDLVLTTTNQYYGISGQIQNASDLNGFAHIQTIASNGSLVDNFKTIVATAAARTDYEVRPSAIYLNPLFADLFDQEAKTLQLYYNEVEVIPGVIVKALPTQCGLLPLIPDPGLVNTTSGAQKQYTAFILSEEFVEYHWLTSPVPRVFQQGLQQNLASQFTAIKFGSVVAKGSSYAQIICRTTR